MSNEIQNPGPWFSGSCASNRDLPAADLSRYGPLGCDSLGFCEPQSENNVDDTVVAISTAIGRGAIGIVRMSGPEALAIARQCVRTGTDKPLSEDSHRLTYGHVVDPATGCTVDEVLVAVMRAPRTYTREDVVEVHCHGGPAAQREVLRLLIRLGARVAEPGEFTKRAFLRGRIDLAQAESVAAIVAARSSGALRASVRQLEGGLSQRLREVRHNLVEQLAVIEASVDFAAEDDDVDEVDWTAVGMGLDVAKGDLDHLLKTSFLGKALEEGVRTAIVGRPNVGKSSLLNALLMRERAIVSDIPGTTRDTIEELMEIAGIPIQLVDTAGVRSGGDQIEKLGVERSFQAMEQADLVLAVFELSAPWTETDEEIVKRLSPSRSIIVGSKKDLMDQATADSSSMSLRQRVMRAKDPVVGSGGAGVAAWQTQWHMCAVSAVSGAGLDELRESIANIVTGDEGIHLDEPVLTAERHRTLVEEALASTMAAYEGIHDKQEEELICEDIRAAISALGRITGEDLTGDLLDEIFSRFCIGK